MPSLRFKVGDEVIFAQHYIAGEPGWQLYEKEGQVMEIGLITVKVKFEGLPGLTTVNPDDLEHLYPEPAVAEAAERLTFSDELDGMNRPQLIAAKLFAQENDPDLDEEINTVLNQNNQNE